MTMTADITALVNHAVQWATNKLGATNYATWCLTFVEDAYERSNDIELDGYASAKEAAEGYDARDDGSVPPKGALVFYDWWGTINGIDRNWGHVGISLGDGRVIHALDEVRVDDYHDVPGLLPTPTGGTIQPRYIGWASVSVVLEGVKPRRWD